MSDERWYMMARDGRATLCADRADAEHEARNADTAWPAMGPHRAVQLVEAGFDAADMATAAAQGFRDGEASAASWISVDARLPEPNTPVLLDIGKMFPIRALWAGKHTVSVGTDVDDWGEYDEETDEYYCPEGWYEWNEHEEVHWAVSETPRAWRELPPPLPAAPGPADGESNE